MNNFARSFFTLTLVPTRNLIESRFVMKKNKSILFAIILLAIVVLGVLSMKIFGFGFFADDTPPTPVNLENVVSPLDAELKAGVNVNGLEGVWSFKHAMKYLSKNSTYKNILSQGFDHIRIPVNFCLLYSEETDSFDEKKMSKFDKILDFAEAYGLYTFIDFHGWWEFGADYAADSQKFLRIWELVAERYRDRSPYIAFELVNEPPIKTMPVSKLNPLQSKALEVIRKTNPDRLVLFAAPDGNQPWLLKDMVVPEDDNIAVAVHIYHPGDFTHQGFTWANREAGKQVRLNDEMMNELKWNLDETKKFIDKTGLPVFLNEFGLNLKLADKKDIAVYLSTITEFCRENNVPWAFWGYNNQEMALYANGKWDMETLDALFLR